MNKVSLSVTIPMYNHEKTIRATLDSILSQLEDIKDICDLEVVIADNCSTDKTPEIIKNEYLPKYADILKYHKNEANIGMSANFNKAIELASQEYVWLFGDDYINEGGIRKICESILKSKHKSFGAIITSANTSDDISKKPINIVGYQKFTNQIFEFDNIEQMSVYNKNNNCCSILQPSFISVLILNRNMALKEIDSANLNNLYTHLYYFFNIAAKNKILLIDSCIVIAQAPSIKRLNIDDEVRVTYDRIVALDEVFNNIDLLSKYDMQNVKRHMGNNIVYFFDDIKDRKKIVQIALKYNIFGHKSMEDVFEKYYNCYFYLLFIKSCSFDGFIKYILKKIGLFNILKKCKQKYL